MYTHRLLVLPAPIKRDGEGQEIMRYLAYITTDKVRKQSFMPSCSSFNYILLSRIQVGLLLLPHDGNPHNSQCLVAHPRAVRMIMITSNIFYVLFVFVFQVSELSCSHDGQYVFTAGGDDCTVNMWTVNTQ